MPVQEALIRDAPACHKCMNWHLPVRRCHTEVEVDDLQRSSGSFASTFGLVPVPRPEALFSPPRNRISDHSHTTS